MKLRNSMLNDFSNCPAKYKAIWIDEIPNPSSAAAIVGTNFHTWATVFFDVIQRAELEEIHLKEKLIEYFMEKTTKEDWSEALLHHCVNFIKFETEHLMKLRGTFEDLDEVWRYFIPYKLELKFETEEFSGTIDRVDLLLDGTLMITDYKTGRPDNTAHRRQVTWYAYHANRIDLFDGLTVSKGAVLWTREPRFWKFDFSSRTIGAINKRIAAMNECKKEGYYPHKPSGLCPYCPVFQTCPAIIDWGKYG